MNIEKVMQKEHAMQLALAVTMKGSSYITLIYLYIPAVFRNEPN